MVRRGPIVPLVAALVLAMLGLAATAVSRARGGRAAVATTTEARPAGPSQSAVAAATGAPERAPALSSVGELAGGTRRGGPAVRPAHAASFELLRLHSAVNLRRKPGGGVIAHVSARTQFGSPATLSVVARRGHWVGVPDPSLANGQLGWLDERTHSAARAHSRLQLVVRLSERRLELRSNGHVKRRMTVGIGRPGSSTPTGHFSVTDKLAGAGYGPFYGCCILALSGHQPHTPAGWHGGDRLAIHGTNDPSSIGVPSSAGCMHASERDLRVLMRRVPLGTPVLIRK